MDASIIPSAGDVQYILSNFRRLSQLCRAWGECESETRAIIGRRLLPGPTYVLAGNLEFYPDDYFVFPREVAAAQRKKIFIDRLKTAIRGDGTVLRDDDAERAWDDYISGAYGQCLRIVLPETIAQKLHLVAKIAEALAQPIPGDEQWRCDLTNKVDALDALLRPFTELDRVRSGGPVLRDRYVTSVRRLLALAS